MFKKVYSLYSAFCTQPAFYSQSAVCILHSVCILPPVRSLQSAVRSLRFTLIRLKSFEIVTTFRYKGRIMKFFNIRKVMVLVSVSIHEARISRTLFGGLKASRR